MKLTQKLLGFLNRVFDKDPGQFLAMRIRYAGTGMTWQVADGVLTTTVSGGSGANLSVDLAQYTLVDLANFIRTQQGYDVVYLDGSEYASLSAMILLDATGDQDASNGDHLYGYTSLLWSYQEALARELQLAADQVAAMPAEMSADTADGYWLDYIGGTVYGIPRGTTTSGGVTEPEPDDVYGPRFIATLLAPAGNNVAIEMGIGRITGQSATVTDAPITGAGFPLFDGSINFDGTQEYNSTAKRLYGLFDVEYSYDLLGADDISSFAARVVAIVNTLRDAGTHMRQLTLKASQLSEVVSPPTDSGLKSVTVSPALTDVAAAPAETESASLSMAPLTDLVPAKTETDNFGWAYSTTYNGQRKFDGSVPFASGGAINEAL